MSIHPSITICIALVYRLMDRKSSFCYRSRLKTMSLLLAIALLSTKKSRTADKTHTISGSHKIICQLCFCYPYSSTFPATPSP
ncbi:hypothetical protein BDW02DRAFT_339381 [Decorospora gaudefroyi]|uniref:Uncharacterized protein n=1 Tax=Decorospora gaudefroyi TaxID=184978 RepID=A0A6A5KDJ5_9PLEO|nr:hypothetical protein BDW02DRAFT_339381 [Decorospora gaudefroyi]